MARSMMKDMTEGKPLKLVLSFAFPLLFGMLFQQFYSFVDTAIVGRYLGAEKLAAVAAEFDLEFADAAKWNIACMFDGLHFSEEGHKTFAQNVLRMIWDPQA